MSVSETASVRVLFLTVLVLLPKLSLPLIPLKICLFLTSEFQPLFPRQETSPQPSNCCHPQDHSLNLTVCFLLSPPALSAYTFSDAPRCTKPPFHPHIPAPSPQLSSELLQSRASLVFPQPPMELQEAPQICCDLDLAHPTKPKDHKVQWLPGKWGALAEDQDVELSPGPATHLLACCVISDKALPSSGPPCSHL